MPVYFKKNTIFFLQLRASFCLQRLNYSSYRPKFFDLLFLPAKFRNYFCNLSRVFECFFFDNLIFLLFLLGIIENEPSANEWQYLSGWSKK